MSDFIFPCGRNVNVWNSCRDCPDYPCKQSTLKTKDDINKPKINYISNKTNQLINLNFRDTSLEFISKCCYNIDTIVDQVINSITLDDSELCY